MSHPRRTAALNGSALVCALFMALASIVGYVCSQATAEDHYALHWPPLPLLIVVFLGIAAPSYAALRALFRWFDHHRRSGWRTLSPYGFFRRHPFALSFAIIALAWLPYLIVYFPGTLTWDGARSMNQFITDAPLENHHPVLMNALYAGLMTLGRTLYSDNLGLLLVVAFQYLACAAAFALAIRQLTAMEAPRWLTIGSLVFYAAYPGWGIFAQTAIKDTLFFAVFCCFVLVLVRLMGAARPSRSLWAALLGTGLALCFTRNNGIYVVLPTLVALAVFFWAQGRRKGRGSRTGRGAHARGAAPHEPRTPASRRSATATLGIMGGCLLAYLLAFQVAWPALGINTKEDKEMMSVPFQQTARTLLEHPDDVTDQERAAISAILPYDQLADLYLPDLADPVKESMLDPSGSFQGTQRSDYLAAWASMGLRHPATYLRATLANTYAYFYPWAIVGPDIDRPLFYVWMQGEPINTTFAVHNVMPDEVRRPVTKFLDTQLDVPVLSALYSPALYVWAFLVLLAYAVHTRNHRGWVLAVPFALLLLTVLAGPLNGQLRYVLPLAAAMPLLAGCLLRAPRPTIASRPSPGRPTL